MEKRSFPSYLEAVGIVVSDVVPDGMAVIDNGKGDWVVWKFTEQEADLRGCQALYVNDKTLTAIKGQCA